MKEIRCQIYSKLFFRLPDFAGAIAELELIEALKTLPDSYCVISDVKLETDEKLFILMANALDVCANRSYCYYAIW